MLLGLAVAVESSREDAEVALGDADRNLRPAERVDRTVRPQQLVQVRRGLDRAERASGLGEQAEAKEPVLVGRNAGEPVAGQPLESISRLVHLAELGVELHEHGPPGRVGAEIEVARAAAEDLVELFESPLLAPEQVELEAVRDRGVPALSPPAKLERRVDRLLGFVEAPLEEDEQCVQRRREPELRGLPQVFCQGRECHELALGAPDVAANQELVEAVHVTGADALVVAGLLAGPQHFGRLREPVLALPGPRGEVAAFQRIGERRAVAEAARALEGLLAQAPASLGFGRVAERTACEAREEANAQRALGVADGLEGTLQQRLKVLVAAGHVEDEAAAVAEGRLAQLLGKAEAVGELGGTEKGARDRGPSPALARASPSASSSSQRTRSSAGRRSSSAVSPSSYSLAASS